MNLWIRSQDKTTLIRSYEIYISEQQNTYLIRAKRTSHILGSYSTIERAIEVLDEIQNILKPKYILNTSSIKPDGDFYEENGVIFQKYNANARNARIEELSTFVYQMPEK